MLPSGIQLLCMIVHIGLHCIPSLNTYICHFDSQSRVWTMDVRLQMTGRSNYSFRCQINARAQKINFGSPLSYLRYVWWTKITKKHNCDYHAYRRIRQRHSTSLPAAIHRASSQLCSPLESIPTSSWLLAAGHHLRSYSTGDVRKAHWTVTKLTRSSLRWTAPFHLKSFLKC